MKRTLTVKNQDVLKSENATNKTMIIQPLTAEQYPSVKKIYEQGIATGHATFQSTAPEWEEWDKSHLAHSRFVAIENNEVVGLGGAYSRVGPMRLCRCG